MSISLRIPSGRFSGGLLAGVAMLAVLSSATPAYAASCSTIPLCKAGSKAANIAATTTFSVALTAFVELVDYEFYLIKDAFVRLANQRTTELQKEGEIASSLTDATTSSMMSNVISGTRADSAIMFSPSRTACVTATGDQKIANSFYSSARQTAYATTQKTATSYGANAPGTPGEKGAIQAAQSAFDESMKGFCDSSVLNPPAGVSCTLAKDSQGRDMDFRFTQPYLAIFGVKDGLIPPSATDNENRAARLLVRMAIEPVTPDGIKGQALARQEGRNSSLMRYSDIAAINLARSTLDRMVDDRIGTSAAGSESVEYLRQKAWNDANQFVEDIKERPSQGTETNLDDVGALMGDINKIYLQLYVNMERLAALRAVHLARTVRESSVGGITSAAMKAN